MKNLKKIIILFFSLFFLISYGQEGSLDTSFGVNGIKLFSIENEGTRGRKLLALDDNSIILGIRSEINASNPTGFYIYKLHENGDIDINFGQNGYLYFSNGNNGNSFFGEIVKQADGKLLLKCSIDGDSNLVRFYQNGDFDLTYGINGIQSIDGGGNIALQSTGKVIVASQFYDGYNNLYKFLRYDTNGSLDLSFGNNGIITTDITGFRFDLCADIKILNNDKIIAVGRSYDSGDDYHPVITRFTEDGFLDSSFGNNGTVISTFTTESELGEFNEIGLFNEQIIVSGNYHYSDGTGGFGGLKPAIIKFNMDGSYDNSFGNQGKVVLETLYNANDYLRTMEIQSNGKILIGGGASSPFPITQTNFFVIKLNDNGELDSNFGNDGVFVTNFNNSESSYVTDLELQENGKILALGVTKDSNNEFRNAIICRLNNETLSTIDFDSIKNISLYPNPVKDILFVNTQSQNMVVKIYSLQGQIIKESSSNSLDVSELNAGLYFAEVNIEGKIFTKRFIKE